MKDNTPFLSSDQLRIILKTVNGLKLQIIQLEEQIRELRLNALKGGNLQ